MQEIKGILIIMTLNSDSKSAGKQAWLVTPSMDIYVLYREGVMDINDSYFETFDRVNVIVEGEIQNEKWIAVKSVTKGELTNIENDIN